MTRAALMRIGAVARVTGVAAETLRAWERRYGPLSSRRSASGYRLFTEADVRRIHRLRRLVDAGHAIGELATLPARELERLVVRVDAASGPADETVASATRERFLRAIEALDVEAAEHALATARVVLRPSSLVRDVVVPLLREVGDRWARETFGIAHEHAASAVVRGQLGERLRTLLSPPGAPTVVCATPSGETHELGALCAAVIAAEAGFRVVYLGPSVPAEELARAAVESGASAAILSCIALPSEATASIDEARRALPRDVALVVGGPRSSSSPGVERLGALEELPSALSRIVASKRR